jgi:hypothetical protein
LVNVLNATVAAQTYLESVGSFLLEEAAAVEAEGDAMISQMFNLAGGAIRLLLQVRARALPVSVKLTVRCSLSP